MTDTALIAAISAGSTLLGSTFSGVLGYPSAKRSTEVQLDGIEAEMDRLKATHDEEDRQERKGVYVAYLDVIDRIDFTHSVWTRRGDL